MAITIEPTFQNGTRNIDEIISFYGPNELLTFYQKINVPFVMVIMSNHPSDPENNVFSVFSPDSQFNCVSRKSLKGRREDSMHQHDYFELMYVLKGSVYQIVEGKRYYYTTGSCCLMNRYTLHTEELSTDFVNLFICLSPDFVSSMFSHEKSLLFTMEKEYSENLIINFLKQNIRKNHKNLKDFLGFVPLITETQQKVMVHDIFEQMLNTLISPFYGATYRLLDLLSQLMDLLCNPHYYNAIHITTRTRMDSMLFARIGQILEEHNGRISNKEIAKMLNYNGTYLGRIVKKYTGKSFSEYSLTFTMKAAENLLKDSQKSISDIINELNFTNRTQFYKLFKQHYGMTPKEYRKKYGKKNIS
ncbi:MAG TPA: AraC family transcriptional regulator [Clostridiaceae bacterium]|nr:AraC family transcriptional regulator [Clostridiaceae bacterium]